MYHHQNAIDNGQPTGNNFLERIQRYGVEQRNIGYGVAEGNAGSATAAVPLFHQRTGYPMAAAVQAGSFLATPNRWFVAETYIDPAPPDVFPSTGGTPIPNARVNAAAVAAQAGRIARVVGWAAHYGDPPKVLADTFHPLNYAGPYVPARTDSGTDLRYNELRCQNYNTKRIAEPGRPTMRYRYAQVIVSRRPIPFPHHPGVALPDSPYGAITHYGSIL